MTTTIKQDMDFLESVVETSLLERSIEWIKINMSPEDIFSEEDLAIWAEDMGFVKEDEVKA